MIEIPIIVFAFPCTVIGMKVSDDIRKTK